MMGRRAKGSWTLCSTFIHMVISSSLEVTSTATITVGTMEMARVIRTRFHLAQWMSRNPWQTHTESRSLWCLWQHVGMVQSNRQTESGSLWCLAAHGMGMVQSNRQSQGHSGVSGTTWGWFNQTDKSGSLWCLWQHRGMVQSNRQSQGHSGSTWGRFNQTDTESGSLW